MGCSVCEGFVQINGQRVRLDKLGELLEVIPDVIYRLENDLYFRLASEVKAAYEAVIGEGS